MTKVKTHIVGHHQVDPKTGKVIQHFGEKSVFIMYVKRHNGRKVVAFMGSGTQLPAVLDFYNEYRVYANDRKYLFHRMTDETADQEIKILMENGKGTMRLERNQAGRKKIDYDSGELSAMKNIPKSILAGLDEFAKKGYVINSQVMTKTRLICILLSEFLEMGDEARVKMLTSGDLLLERHKLLCGGIDPERIQKMEVYQEDLGDLL
jgi:hypothetical protein